MAKVSTPPVDEVETDAVEAILDVDKALKANLINRTEAIRALLLGIVAEQNVLFEGPPGTAKTKLGALFASYVRSDEFTFFKTQLMKGSVPEQLFGPLNVTKMREEAVWEYNTKKMLPTAHLAILEEVFRAPEMLLSSMLTVLNERLFHNGHRVEKCPLICAIGTTNFVTSDMETEAFNDRWLLRVKIDVLKSSDERLRMLTLANLGPDAKETRADISLDQIRALHELRRKVKIDPELMQLFEQMVGKLQKQDMSIKLTDRRIVQTLDLIRASAVLAKRENAMPDDLTAAEFGVTIKGNSEDANKFESVFSATVGNYQKLKEEAESLQVLEKRAAQIEGFFDSKLSNEKLKKLQLHSKQMLAAMEDNDQQWVSDANKRRYDDVKANVERVLREVTEKLG